MISPKFISIVLCLSFFIPTIYSQKIAITDSVEREIDQLFVDYEDKPGCAVGIYYQGEIIFFT